MEYFNRLNKQNPEGTLMKKFFTIPKILQFTSLEIEFWVQNLLRELQIRVRGVYCKYFL